MLVIQELVFTTGWWIKITPPQSATDARQLDANNVQASNYWIYSGNQE
jgi:hypothetical protein